MKNILLYVGPRAASKSTQRNLIQYVKASTGNVYDLKHEHIELVDQFIEDRNLRTTDEKYNHVVIENQQLVITNELWNKEDELNHRTFNLLPNLPKNLVMKMLPFDLIRENFIKRREFAFNFFDRIYVIKRQNTFEQTLSFCINMVTQRWDYQDNLVVENVSSQRAKEQVIEKPIHIDQDFFQRFYMFMELFNQTNINQNDKIINLKFEDIIKINDAKDFTELFELPYINFDFLGFKKELLDVKQLMVSNYQELLELSQKI